MGRRGKTSVLKRQRERKKAEKAALKREQRQQRQAAAGGEGTPVAKREDLEGYGLITPEDDEGEDETD